MVKVMKAISYCFLFYLAAAQALPTADYFPVDHPFDSTIPTPEKELGYEPGSWHYTPDQIRRYAESLAHHSQRVSLWAVGRTHEQRPQLLLAITSEQNTEQLDTLRLAHLEGRDAPLVVWQGYSIHGNESSGANASLLYAYYLAASTGSEVADLLEKSIVLIDPMMNPDGLARAAAWFNANRGALPVGDPQSREHNEAWPNGRTNHYWFDLNRDWLLLQQPESVARIEQFYHWRPHLFGDYHEMGGNRSYFFQPGVPTRQNPLTSEENVKLTRALARFHADALDEVAEPYFSEERFDDFYYGKGSTYPDVVGSIGILFEQTSSRGHLMRTDAGDIPFSIALRNQLLTSMSLLRGGVALAAEIKRYRRDFQRLEGTGKGAWLVADDGDPGRLALFIQLLERHRISYQWVDKTVEVESTRFVAGHAIAVPRRQQQWRLVEALFETRTSFDDNAFYDVSTWNLPLSFGLPYAHSSRHVRVAEESQSELAQPFVSAEYGYAIAWDHLVAPSLVQRLLASEVPLKVSTKPLQVLDANDAATTLGAGTITVVVAGLEEQRAEIEQSLQWAAKRGARILPVETGWTPEGPDFGSDSMPLLKQPKPAMIVGPAVNAYEAGEVWYLLDQRIGIPLTLLDTTRLNAVKLADYTHLIMVDGDYNFGEKQVQRIERWVNSGGVLIVQQRAADWTGKHLFVEEESAEDASADDTPETDDPEVTPRRSYADLDTDKADRVIGGALLRADLDITHPLGWGYHRNEFSFFKKGTTVLDEQTNPYHRVAVVSHEPLLSGYVSEALMERTVDSNLIDLERHGDGAVVRFAFDPNFRSIMYGTQRLFVNALYFGALAEKAKLKKLP